MVCELFYCVIVFCFLLRNRRTRTKKQSDCTTEGIIHIMQSDCMNVHHLYLT
ncbi:hypothetical protein RchiOBHm_Chr1g0383901 [Rosa chinensis]|uniref:Uncharacterized protein n=1 Tax=Rosa chinensis TaxID=74649 RepID=A0A2P6SPR8_ROSCH|nr:hypothetical protein RchiOBHm_Chr1g0383901 [Rosa chinensis]